MSHHKSKPLGCAASGCIGSIAGAALGCLALFVAGVILAQSAPDADMGGPLLWPIAAFFLSIIGGLIGGFIGALIGLIRSSRAKSQSDNEPPIAPP